MSCVGHGRKLTHPTASSLVPDSERCNVLGSHSLIPLDSAWLSGEAVSLFHARVAACTAGAGGGVAPAAAAAPGGAHVEVHLPTHVISYNVHPVQREKAAVLLLTAPAAPRGGRQARPPAQPCQQSKLRSVQLEEAAASLLPRLLTALCSALQPADLP